MRCQRRRRRSTNSFNFELPSVLKGYSIAGMFVTAHGVTYYLRNELDIIWLCSRFGR